MKTASKSKNLKWNHTGKVIEVTRQLNPPSFNARFIFELQKENPDYTIIKSYEKQTVGELTTNWFYRPLFAL